MTRIITMLTGGQQQKHIADRAAVSVKQHSSSTYSAAATEQQQNNGRSNSSITSCTPEATPGTTVGAGQTVSTILFFYTQQAVFYMKREVSVML